MQALPGANTALNTYRGYLTGCAIIVAAGFVLSLGAFNVRLASDAGPWQYTFWRSWGFIAAMAVIASYRDHRSPLAQLAELRPIAWVGAFMITLASTTFIAAF